MIDIFLNWYQLTLAFTQTAGDMPPFRIRFTKVC